jgi:hypothetical protein
MATPARHRYRHSPAPRPPGRKLRAMFSSDVGHWDVSGMSHLVTEACEMVADGHRERRESLPAPLAQRARFRGLAPGYSS